MLTVVALVTVWPHAATARARPESQTMTPSTERPAETELALDLMADFAERTGLSSDRPPRRYLWTDAFAVCTYLGLTRTTGEERHQELALRLIEQVHHVLGRHRGDDPREGWLSGLTGEEAEQHPTRGGLRIGKELPERRSDEALDERLEWERDGQYFHYLTKWMMALDLTARATGDARYSRWALELAEAAYRGFVYRAPDGTPRMVWKASIDLRRPLVASMGHHDPLDGLVTYLEVEEGALQMDAPGAERLQAEIETFEAMLRGRDLATADPLGLGGLLMDAGRVSTLSALGVEVGDGLLETLLQAAVEGLAASGLDRQLSIPASNRLAFRELGLAIGLSAGERLSRRLREGGEPTERPAASAVESLTAFLPLRARIVDFWSRPLNREGPTWRDHRDINAVMLAAALVPEGCLLLEEPGN